MFGLEFLDHALVDTPHITHINQYKLKPPIGIGKGENPMLFVEFYLIWFARETRPPMKIFSLTNFIA